MFLTQDQLNFATQNGLYEFLEQIQAEILLTTRDLFNKEVPLIQEKLQISRAGYYKLLNKALKAKNK